MDWVTLLVSGLFAFAWLAVLHQARTESWTIGRTGGWLIFLSGTTIGTFYDNALAAESPLLPWVEPIAAVVMVVGISIAWLRTPSEAN